MAKRYKGKIDFKSKETVRQVVILWNKLNIKQKKSLSLTQLQEVVDVARGNNRADIYQQVYPIFNRKRSAVQYKKRGERISATRKLNKMSELEYEHMKEAQKLYTKIKKIQKRTGIEMSTGDAFRYGLPNPEIFTMSKEEFIERQALINEQAPEKQKVKNKTARKKAEENYEKAFTHGRKLRLRDLDNSSFEYGKEMIETYFLHGDSDKNEIILEYFKMLNVEDRYRLLRVLSSNVFKRIWDSDPDNTGQAEKENQQVRANARQDVLLQILKHETKKRITLKNDKIHIKAMGKLKFDEEKTFDHYLK